MRMLQEQLSVQKESVVARLAETEKLMGTDVVHQLQVADTLRQSCAQLQEEVASLRGRSAALEKELAASERFVARLEAEESRQHEVWHLRRWL